MAAEPIDYSETPQAPRWTLGDRLAKARNHAGFDQKHMARMFNCSPAAISAWERDENQPRTMLEVVAAWAKETNVPLWWLLGTDDGSRSRWASPEALRLIPGGQSEPPLTGQMIPLPLPFLTQVADN